MAQIKNLIARWDAAWPSPMIISRQYDNCQFRIDLMNYPEPEVIVDEQTEQMEILSYYLIVWMKETEDGEYREMSPIMLPGPYWIVPNQYTQLVQDIRFQFCVQSDSTEYEAHSAIFTGRVVDSIEHDGTAIDVIPVEMFDAYKAYIQEIAMAAGAVVIDPNLDTTGAAADAKAVGDAIKAGKPFVVQVPGSAAVYSGSITAGDFAKALAAYTAGSGVYAVKDGEIYQLSAAGSATMTFTQMYYGTMAFIKQIQITSADTFTVTNTALSSSAEDTSYSNTASGLAATNVQAAIDENAANVSETNERLGNLEQSAGGILAEQSGTSIEVNLSDTLSGIKYLTVAGKTEQEGTPELDNPADIVGLGDLDSTTGTYTVTVPVTDGGGVVHNIVATGLAYPLYDGDTLDLVTGVIDRKNGQIIFDGTQQPRASSISNFDVNPRSGAYNLALTNRLPYSSSSSSVNTFGGNASGASKPNYIVIRLGVSTKEEALAILASKPVQFVYKIHDIALPYTEQVTVTGFDAVNQLTGTVTINSETMLTAKWALDAKSYIDNADSALDSRISTNAVGIAHLEEGSYPITEVGEFVIGSWWDFNDKYSTPGNKCRCAAKLSLPTDAFIKCDPGYKFDLYTASQTTNNNVHAVVKAGELFVINISEIASGPPAIEDPAEIASHVRIYSPITSEYNRLYESFAGFDMFNSIGFVGDSYTANAPNGISWGKVIERRLGIDVGVYGHSGYSSSTFIQNGLLDAMLASNLRELYWIEFVINDSSRYHDEPAYLGSESDVSGGDYTAYPDTLWGNYGRIIESILAANPTAKIVLCKGTFANLRTAQIDTGVTNIPVVNAEVDDIGAHYGVPVVNPLDDMFYWSMVFTGSMSSNHPKALGMPGIASAKMRMFSRCVQDNISYFYA